MKLKNNKKYIKYKSKSKLIITGEYFVLKTKYSITITINKFIIISIEKIKKYKNIIINFFDFNIYISQNLKELIQFGNSIYSKYLNFLSKNFKIEKILNKNTDLIKFSLFFFLQNLTLK